MAANRPQSAHKAPTKTPAELQRQLVEFHTAALETAQRQLEAERDKPDPDEKKLLRAARSIQYHGELLRIAEHALYTLQHDLISQGE